jgi:hypothetical protein
LVGDIEADTGSPAVGILGYADPVNRKSLSQVKNLMRRALADAIDPPPGPHAQQALRDYFENKCAYCGAEAIPRQGHIDHATRSGGNSLGNLLLACSPCNGDQKREKDWAQFLHEKCGKDQETFERRRQHIQTWMERHRRQEAEQPVEVRDAREAAEKAIDAFAVAYGRVRDAVAKSRQTTVALTKT